MNQCFSPLLIAALFQKRDPAYVWNCASVWFQSSFGRGYLPTGKVRELERVSVGLFQYAFGPGSLLSARDNFYATTYTKFQSAFRRCSLPTLKRTRLTPRPKR